ncbi:phosphoenolpyruvate-protein phosphotransferase PtsI [Buchnera aphidicola (Kurisakia onigurumii)]|uniref:phosphoenolpyruvate-protein phosphotransferase PtsI n=1 Tax=Buchnera aphidicola TaxID=9 RepID=UPI0031B67CC6
MISGISVSPGVVFGKTLLLNEKKISINDKLISKKDVIQEIKKFIQSRKKSIQQIKVIKENSSYNLKKEQKEIFEGHIMLLEDEDFEEEIISLIKNNLYSSDKSVSIFIENQIKSISKIENEYLKNRIIDIQDIGNRLIKNILNINIVDLNNIQEPVILIAKDLTPSETAQMNLKKILGFITEQGGKTSHTSIIARSLELPAIVGVSKITKNIKNNDFIILDSINNEIFINPSINIIKEKKIIKKNFLKNKHKLKKIKNISAVTLDGHKIELGSNIGSPNDIQNAKKYGAKCIGLYRTEFLFMERNNFPSEDEQFEAYKKVAVEMQNKPVIIRTMDVGGDKNLSYIDLPKEENPFLGCRAIRVSMLKKEILNTQIRAILRASYFGKLRIMFPMIISVEEVRKLKNEIIKIKNNLKDENQKFDEFIKIGIMIETPAAAMISDHLSKEVDFFSIGSNDLTQYTLAVDRGNDLISNLYNPMSPSVLRLMKKVIDASHMEGKWTGICGELASDEKATLLLLGMGIDEFSMSSSCIPIIKDIIINSNFTQAQKLAKRALSQSTVQELIHVLKNDI